MAVVKLSIGPAATLPMSTSEVSGLLSDGAAAGEAISRFAREDGSHSDDDDDDDSSCWS